MEDDEISVTSTVATIYDSDTEFTVDRVLAERVQDGTLQYLLSWLGYPEAYRNSWEPAEQFGEDGAVYQEWEERRLLEERGQETPFDIQEWEEMMSNRGREKSRRQRLREEKRRHSKIRATSESDSEFDEAMEIDTTEEYNGIVSKPPKKTSFKKAQIFGQHGAQRGSRSGTESSSDDLHLSLLRVQGKTKEKAKELANKVPDPSTFTGNARPEEARQPNSKVCGI